MAQFQMRQSNTRAPYFLVKKVTLSWEESYYSHFSKTCVLLFSHDDAVGSWMESAVLEGSGKLMLTKDILPLELGYSSSKNEVD